MLQYLILKQDQALANSSSMEPIRNQIRVSFCHKLRLQKVQFKNRLCWAVVVVKWSAFYSDNPNLKPAEVLNFSVKLLLKRTDINKSGSFSKSSMLKVIGQPTTGPGITHINLLLESLTSISLQVLPLTQ